MRRLEPLRAKCTKMRTKLSVISSKDDDTATANHDLICLRRNELKRVDEECPAACGGQNPTPPGKMNRNYPPKDTWSERTDRIALLRNRPIPF